MRRTMQLNFFATNRVLTNVELPTDMTGAYELQLRHDLAREYDVQPGEGNFTVRENGVIINTLPIPE